MNPEYKKVLLESLEKVHQAIDEVEPVELPSLVHAEIEILSTMEKSDQEARNNEYRKEDEVDFLKRGAPLGKRIKAIRRKKLLTQTQFGELFNPPASASNVARWENDKNFPNKKRISQIADLAGINVSQLLRGGD